MKRELKKLFDKNRVITNEWYLMTIENSTAEEREKNGMNSRNVDMK